MNELNGRGLGVTLRESFEVYRTHFRELYLLSAVVGVIGALAAFAADRTVSFAGSVVSLLVTSVLPALLVDFFMRVSHGEAPTAASTWSAVAPRLGAVIGLALLRGALIGLAYGVAAVTGLIGEALPWVPGIPFFVLGMIVGLALALFVAVVLAFAMHVLVAEERTPLDALRRSVDLTRGARWRILGYYAVAGAMTLGVNIAVGFVIGFLPFPGILRAVAGGLATALTTPFFYGVTIILFVGIRNERERFGASTNAPAGDS